MASSTYASYENTSTSWRPRTGRRSTGRPRTGRPPTARPRTGASTIAVQKQELVCAVTESRGISPTVGLAFINLDTGEVALSQISDSGTYVRTIHKITVYAPSQIILPSTAANPPSKLFSIIEEHIEQINANLVCVDRRYYAETSGIDSIRQLAFAEDVEAINVSIGGNFYAVCCFAAALKYIEFQMAKTFQFHSLRVKYEPPESSMMIDISTICSLELIQNLQNPKSRHCLYGLLNETLTPMGGRMLRSNILQPSTSPDTILKRYDSVQELTVNEDMFFALILIPTKSPIAFMEQSVNQIITLKQFLVSLKPTHEALASAQTSLMSGIRENCSPQNTDPIFELINEVINDDTQFAKGPLELRNQRIYAVKSGAHGLLDVARQTYKESVEDAYRMVEELGTTHNLPLELKFEQARQFYMRVPAQELEDRPLPAEFIHCFKKKNTIECQTLGLVKLNQKITDCHIEVLEMSNNVVQKLTEEIRTRMYALFKACESIALLDMLASFAHIATTQGYVRPQLTDTLAIQAGRHALREKFHSQKYIPNDVYAAQQARFQIITGCNMSGKSTYIRSIALMTVMAQIGSFVPASYASFPIISQLFARVNMDDSIEANVSTFASEMRETAFILRNIDRRSLAIIDELGRGTSTRDGLAIALAIAEALVESRALVWFATHFRDLATIMAERNGVINLHLAVDIGTADSEDPKSMTMLYKIAEGAVQEQHYGLKLARVLPLPPKVLETAEEVAAKLESHVAKRKKTSALVIKERKRKLILHLREHLTQAKNGVMEGEVLANWLKELQKEFVVRMTAIDAEAAEVAEAMDQDGETVVDE
ncbi:hypothetical protein BLS_000367 [Venturia inaequalis]|uniref:DNA mismatch repair proteins mutS family domain-containing protein n=1 Tax=Venturia inaequalis TaxID=5025 RepID=A0A8H3Z0H5_VENIN|nr:hypothetical protein BLS_000367 [Venturia inaequalis]